VKKLAAIAMIWLIMSALAGCQSPQPTPTVAPTPTATHTALPPTPTAKPTITPTPQLNSPNGPPLLSMRMFTKGDGWGLIFNALLLTHDGGLTWFSVPMPAAQVNEDTQAYFADVNTIYMVLPSSDGQTGQLNKTDNGGGTWRSNIVPFLHGQLTFSGQTGYFLETTRKSSKSMSVALFATLDDGFTWERVFPGANQDPGSDLPEDGIKTGCAFISPERGWLGLADQHQKVVLYKSENGGRNWFLQDIPVPQNITSLISSTLPPVFFPGDLEQGVLPVDYVSMDSGDRNRVFYFTYDGGVNWTPGESIIDGGVYTFLDAKTGWAWGKRGLFFSSDGGQTWQLLPVAFGRSEYATNLTFIDVNTGWLLTTDAKNRVRIYTTSDGGSTWIAINP